jgi:hypothetical protein
MAKSYSKKMYKRKNTSKRGLKKRYTLKGGRILKGGSSGCSTCMLKGGSKKKRRGGDFTKSILAYTGKPIYTQRNPFLAYTGKGGNKPIPNIANAYPNPGNIASKTNFINLSPNAVTIQSGGKYPNGLTGDPWTSSIQTWPGVNGIDSDNNHFQLNTYDNDVSRQMVDVGPGPPFNVGGSKKKRVI